MLSTKLGPGFNVVRGAITAAAAIGIISLSQAVNAQTLYVFLGDNTIHKITSAGVDQGVWANTSTGNAVTNMAFDSQGNLFAAYGTGVIEKFTPGGVGSIFANTGVGTAIGLAIDSADNVFITNAQPANKVLKYTPGGVSSVFATTGLSNPSGIAVDSADNIYVANYNVNSIRMFTPGGVGSVFASSGLNGPRGLNFDHLGNLYAVNRLDNTVEKFTSGGTGSVFANTGISSGEGLAVDSSNNVYVSNTGTNSIQKFTSAGVGSTFVTFTGKTPYAMAFQQVPEPGSIALGAIGIATAGFMIRKRRRSRK